ncbi:MAG: hypothetical protein NC548_55440 [Lachnospiraceae bacterium]|nr:hypothetical protein [Lachnospiraceae bacterium]
MEDFAYEAIKELGGEWQEDGICMGTEEDSVYYACDHDAEDTFYKTTYGNMCDGIVEDDEIQMTLQEVLEDIQCSK